MLLLCLCVSLSVYSNTKGLIYHCNFDAVVVVVVVVVVVGDGGGCSMIKPCVIISKRGINALIR